MTGKKSTRRAFLRGAALMGGALAWTACQPQVVEKIVKETVVVEQEVEKVVKETVIVEKPVEKVVEKVVEKTVVVQPQSTPVEQVMIGAFDVGPGGCPQCYDPLLRSAGATWMAKLWAPLATWDPGGARMIPELAESWSGSDDAKVWTVKLREGLKWSDGEPLTTKDLYFEAKVRTHPDFNPAPPAPQTAVEGAQEYYEGKADEISGIKIIDDTTIEYHLVEPNPLWTPGGLEMAEHHFKQWTPGELAGGSMWLEWRPCSGPFEWSRFERDQYTEAKANPYYWRGRPKLDTLINRYFVNETTAVLALQRGEIDFTYISGDVVNPLKAVPEFEVVAGPSFVTNFIIFNFNEPALQDLRVRQAFLHAIDREKIIETLYDGAAQKLNTLFSQPDYNLPSLKDYPYDPEKAKQLLQDANWQQDEPWELWTYYDSQLSLNVMQAIQQYLAEVGIETTPRPMDVPTFNNLFPTGEDWKIAYIGQGHNAGPVNAFARWHKDGQPKFVGDCQAQHGCHEQLDEMSAAIDTYMNDIDPEVRLKAAQEVARIMNEVLPDAYLWVTERYGCVNKHIQNFVWSPLPAGGPYYDQAELWEVSS